jgi:hypothetical protein
MNYLIHGVVMRVALIIKQPKFWIRNYDEAEIKAITKTIQTVCFSPGL